MLNYFILIFININPIFGGKFLAASYITIAKLNPFLSVLIIIISEVIVCVLIFYFAQYLRKFNFFKKRLNNINDKWIKKGAYIGFFAGQLFMGTLFISLILGLVENRKNDVLFFYIPLIVSTVCYTMIYYYLSSHGINLMKNWL
ncbi:MAG: hypothetical protein M1407_05835 [Deltaproteobacteria bacterium]|nr:hypothetical protein [Deltaproteobacteria bacterium]